VQIEATPSKRTWNLHEIYSNSPWNLPGTSMEPPWNLHQSEYMIKQTNTATPSKRTWNLHEIYSNSPWNLHGTSMKTASVGRRHATTFRHKKQRNPHETSMKPTSLLHGTCMEAPSKKTPYKHQV